MQRDSFIFYRSFYEGIKELPRDIQGEVLTAIMEYGLNGVTTENLKPVAKAMFALIKPQLDANNKRFDNGKKGGRPKQDETKAKPNDNQTITNHKPNVNDNDNVNVNVNENENINTPNGGQIDFDKLLSFINQKTGRNYKAINDSVRKKYRARLKDGYSKEDILTAIKNAVKIEYHTANNFQYLTPEFFSRAETIEKYSAVKTVNHQKTMRPAGVWDV